MQKSILQTLQVYNNKEKSKSSQLDPSIEIIPVNLDTKYLNEVMSKLPTNCIFDKGKVGCGATSIALESDDPYVIAVPYISLIENKVAQYNGDVPHSRFNGKVMGVKAGVTQDHVLDYIRTSKTPPKLMVTYDSLGKLTEWIPSKDYKLLIDESHILFTSYDYRKKAVQTVLNSYKEYKEFCFMTGSPMDNDFVLEELRHIRRVVADWEKMNLWRGGFIGTGVNSIECLPNVGSVVGEIILDFFDVKWMQDFNAYFFVNSLKFIGQLIRDLGLSDENTRVVYSMSNEMDVGIKRGSPSDPPKKINFITSAAFEGVDFHDKDALIFVVSDYSNPHTLVDISTSLVQIEGRIRDRDRVKNIDLLSDDRIFHLYSLPKYKSGTTYNEYKALTESENEKSKGNVERYNAETDDYKKNVKLLYNDLFITEKDGNYTFDTNISKHYLYNFKLKSCLYRASSALEKEYLKYGFTNVRQDTYKAKRVFKMEEVRSASFKEIMMLIEVHWDNQEEREGLIRAAQAKYKRIDIRRAITELGFDKIRDYKYNITNVMVKLIGLSSQGLEQKIFDEFIARCPKCIEPDTYISSKNAKKEFGKVYESLGISKTPKGTDIEDYFIVKKTVGKSRGYIILSTKS